VWRRERVGRASVEVVGEDPTALGEVVVREDPVTLGEAAVAKA
jgi:hypothetical protein